MRDIRANLDRARWAEYAVEAFQEETRADDEDAVADLLCDLMHYCDATKQYFNEELTRALSHYAAETEGD